jgi:hypothetical protein
VALVSINLFAAETLTVNVDELKVYTKPAPDSPVLTTLYRGTTLPASSQATGRYKKVLALIGGKKVIGFVKMSDLVANMVSPGPETRAAKPQQQMRSRKAYPTLHGVYAAGITLGGHYQYQGTREYSDPARGESASIGVLSGLNFEVGGFLNIPYNNRHKIHTYVQYKSIALTGTATLRTSLVPSAEAQTTLKQTFLVVGAMVQAYPSERANWWWGGGFQVDKAMDGTLQFGGYSPATLSGSDLPTFIKAYGAIGADFILGKRLFLVPDFRFGALVNATPLIAEAELDLNIAYSF